MPVQIGATSHSFSDPTGLLTDCHRRIEMFLGSLEKVGALLDRPLTDEEKRALETSLRYFREAAPKHNADEEESLFPRLRQVADRETDAALQKMKQLEEEHRWAAPLHDRVDALGRECLEKGSLSPEAAEAFREAVAQLGAMYREHIRVEDKLIFPLAARILPQHEQAAIAKEMAARREIAPIRISPVGE